MKPYFTLVLILCLILIATSCSSDKTSSPDCPSSIGQDDCYIAFHDLSDPNHCPIFVRPVMDFGDQDQLNEFPLEINDWKGRDFYVDPWKEQVAATYATLRGYREPDTNELWLLLIQSGTQPTVQPPNIHYPAMGWEIVKEGIVTIALQGERSDQQLTESTSSSFSSDLNVSSLLVSTILTDNNRNFEQQRLILYCYFQELAEDATPINMIRVSMIIPDEGSYEETLDIEIGFLADILPLIFEPLDDQ